MWRKGDPCALLVGLQTGVAPMANSMEIPQKTKISYTIQPSNFIFGYLSKETKTLIQKDIHTPMFITALFTIA